MSSETFEQGPVAKVCWQYDGREFGGSIPTGKSIFPIGPISGLEVGTLLYAFPPDAAARIAKLEQQRDTLLNFVERISRQKAEPYFAKEATAVIASMKGGAA